MSLNSRRTRSRHRSGDASTRGRFVFVPPARPVESRRPGGRRRRGYWARWLLHVAVIAVTGAVKAVGSAVTGAVGAVTRGRDPAP